MPILALIAIYVISNFLLLLSRGLYWDGWYWITLIQNQNYQTIWETAASARLYNVYYLFRLTGTATDPVFALKLLAFASWLLAGIFLYGILRKKLSLKIDRAFFVSASFLLITSFLVKAEISMLQYAVNNALFFAAIFLYVTAEKNQNRLFRNLTFLASWLLFFISFLTNSFLVFYGGFLALLFLLYRQEHPEHSLKSLILPWLKKEWLFVILPIIFGLLKLYAGRPAEGPYSDYNQFIALDKNFLPTLIQNIWQFVVYGFFWPIFAPLSILPRKIFAGIFLIIGGLFYALSKKSLSSQEPGKDFSAKTYLISGLALFVLGIIPYLAVSKAPHVFGNGFAMRHTLLLPLGSSLIILGILLAAVKEKWQLIAQTILLSLFSVFTIFNYYLQDMDWYKQKAIITSLKETKNEAIINATSLIFHDKMGINWQNRNIRGEEYFGYIQSAFPKEKWKFTASEEHDPIKNYYLNEAINSRSFPAGFDPAKKVVKVEIISRALKEITTAKNWLKLKKSEVLGNESQLLKDIKDIYRVEIIPLN